VDSSVTICRGAVTLDLQNNEILLLNIRLLAGRDEDILEQLDEHLGGFLGRASGWTAEFTTQRMMCDTFMGATEWDREADLKSMFEMKPFLNGSRAKKRILECPVETVFGLPHWKHGPKPVEQSQPAGTS
jgi:hypothetical protein